MNPLSPQRDLDTLRKELASDWERIVEQWNHTDLRDGAAVQRMYEREGEVIARYGRENLALVGAHSLPATSAVVADYIRGWRGLRVLDLGCGPHPQSSLPLMSGNRVMLVDVSFGFASTAREIALRQGHDCPVIVAANEHLPFKPGVFDRIMFLEVLEHLVDPAAPLAELRRVLKPEGGVLLSTPNWNAFPKLSQRSKDWLRGGRKSDRHYYLVPSHVTEYTRRGLLARLHGAFTQVQFLFVPYPGSNWKTRLLTGLSRLPGCRWLGAHWLTYVSQPAKQALGATIASTDSRLPAAPTEPSPNKLDLLQRQLRQFYGSCGEYFTEAHQANLEFSPERQAVFAFIPPQAKVLDVGCGSCENGLRISSAASYVGCDVSATALKLAHASLPPEKRNFTQGESHALPFKTGSFEVVLSTYALEHFVFPRESLDEMWRVCRPGGRVLLISPAYDDPRWLPPSTSHWSFWARFRLVGAQAWRQFLRHVRPHYFHFARVEAPRILTDAYQSDFDAVHLVSAREIGNYFRAKGATVLYERKRLPRSLNPADPLGRRIREFCRNAVLRFHWGEYAGLNLQLVVAKPA